MSTISSQEIISIIKSEIESFDVQAGTEQETGSVIWVGDGIAICYGIDHAMYGEIVVFENGVKGMVQDIRKNEIGCILFGKDTGITEGTKVTRTKRRAGVPVGQGFLGRVINALGEPIDGLGPVKEEGYLPVEEEAPGIVDRKSVGVPLETGILAIDSMFPIGRGQRELIIGDRQTGKTSIAMDTILNQKGKDVICIYVAIGQKNSTVAKIYNSLEKGGAMEYSIILSADGYEDEIYTIRVTLQDLIAVTLTNTDDATVTGLANGDYVVKGEDITFTVSAASNMEIDTVTYTVDSNSPVEITASGSSYTVPGTATENATSLTVTINQVGGYSYATGSFAVNVTASPYEPYDGDVEDVITGIEQNSYFDGSDDVTFTVTAPDGYYVQFVSYSYVTSGSSFTQIEADEDGTYTIPASVFEAGDTTDGYTLRINVRLHENPEITFTSGAQYVLVDNSTRAFPGVCKKFRKFQPSVYNCPLCYRG